MVRFAVPLHRTEHPLFRAVHAFAPLSRKTLRDRVIEHSANRHNEALRALKGKTVTVAIDAGTVFNKYLGVVLLAHGLSPLIVRMSRCESATSECIEECVRSVVAEQGSVKNGYSIFR
jgi:hypothetical protein